MPDFISLKDAFAHIQKKVDAALMDNVADAIRFEEQKQIEKIVYESYDPFMYERRGYNSNGLQDIDMMVAAIEKRGDGVVLSVVNIAKGSHQEDLYLAPLIEYGDNTGHGEYDYKYNRNNTSWKYLHSRPFTEATVEALQASKKHIQAMREGLRERGLNVE